MIGASPGERTRAGGDALLRFLPPEVAARRIEAARRGESHGRRWRRHVDVTGGDVLWFDPGPPSVAVVDSHNMALYAIEEARRTGLLGDDAHVVHVDDHPDFLAPERLLPVRGDAMESFETARSLRWDDWITAGFARGVVGSLTDVSRGDLGHEPPFVAVTGCAGIGYLEAGRSLGEPHGPCLRFEVPADAVYRLSRRDGFGGEVAVVVAPDADAPAGTTAGVLALAARIATEGRRLETAPAQDGCLVRLPAGRGWLLAAGPEDGARLPAPLRIHLDPAATAAAGIPVRTLERIVETLPGIEAHPPEAGPGGLVLDVDLDWLNVLRQHGKTDAETITAQVVAEFAATLRRAVPAPNLVTIALSPDSMAPLLQAEAIRDAGIANLPIPPPDAGIREARRRLGLFLRFRWR